MMVDACLLTESPFAYIRWPANGSVALVLDGAAIPNVARSIYEWSEGAAKTECLYAGTRWESVSDFAPWVVWLDDESDRVVRVFMEMGARKEWGYILVSNYGPNILRGYLRQLLVVERVPGCVELIRIAHPEMARCVIGEELILPGMGLPPDLIQQVVSPDLINGIWAIQESPTKPNVSSRESAHENCGALETAFCAFNRRRDSLALWEMLDSHVREWLGGPALKDAVGKLDQITEEAEWLGHSGARHKFRYLLDMYRNDRLLSHTNSRTTTDA